MGWSCIRVVIPCFTSRIGGTMIFPSGVVMIDAVMNLSSRSTMMSLLLVSPLSASGRCESASGGMLVFPST